MSKSNRQKANMARPIQKGVKAKPATRVTAKSASARKSSSGKFVWLTVGVVVVVVVGLLVAKVTTGGGGGGSSNSGFQATSTQMVSELTQVPTAVFNTVGITSGVGSISPPAPLVGQPELTGTSSTGATLPEVLYVGAEYCPYCAAERWSTIIALSRFGTFTGLGNTVVPSTEAPYGGVTSFTFLKTTFKSKYLVFNAVERYTNIPDPATHFYTPLQKMNKIEKANFKKYDNSKYIPGISASQTGAIPYINYANRFVSAGSSFSPSLLENLTRSQIAVGLSSASSPITQAIIATANYQSAIICSLTNNQPGSVCSSPGVMLAKKSLKIK